MAQNATTDATETRTETIMVVRDYHMSPEDAGPEEDPTETLLVPAGDYDPAGVYFALETVEIRTLHGDAGSHVSDDDLPEVGEEAEWGEVEHDAEGNVHSWTWADEFAPEDGEEVDF